MAGGGRVGGHLTLNSKNLIYCKTLFRYNRKSKSHPQYIVLTGQKVLDRLGKHRNSIKPNSEEKNIFCSIYYY